MFIITKKVPRRKLTAALFLFLLTLGLFGAGLDLSKDIQAASATLHTLPDPTGIRTNAERIAYLEGYGWITGEAYKMLLFSTEIFCQYFFHLSNLFVQKFL